MGWDSWVRQGTNVARNIPVVGDLLPEEQVDQNSIDTGGAYYDRPASNAQEMYNQALARSQASYQAGPIRDVDLSGADALRGQQTANLGSLQAASTGQAPSVAQAQYAAALGQQQNAALGVVAGSRGAGRGAGRLQVASQFGAQAGVNAQQQAAAVAQERQNALAQYTAALQGARGQDIGLATDRAQLGISRDVAADAAGRGAFLATNQAQLGYLGAANQAVDQQRATAAGQAGAKQQQYMLARAEEERRAKARAANRQAMTGYVKTAMEMGNKTPPAGAGAAAAGGGVPVP
jgi:hypothetical protein